MKMKMPPTFQRTIHAWVSGRVQGISYRQATLDFAQPLGITGWAKKLTGWAS